MNFEREPKAFGPTGLRRRLPAVAASSPVFDALAEDSGFSFRALKASGAESALPALLILGNVGAGCSFWMKPRVVGPGRHAAVIRPTRAELP